MSHLLVSRVQVSSLTSSPDSSPSPIAIALGQVSAANGGGSNGSSTNMSIGGMNGQSNSNNSGGSLSANGTGIGGGGTANGGGGELHMITSLVCYARTLSGRGKGRSNYLKTKLLIDTPHFCRGPSVLLTEQPTPRNCYRHTRGLLLVTWTAWSVG